MPIDAWPAWLEALQIKPPYQLYYRSTNPRVKDAYSPEDIVRLAESHGAHSIRFIADDVATNPALAAAWYTAEHHRLNVIVVAEIGARHATLAVHDARRGTVAFRQKDFEAESCSVLPEVVGYLEEVLVEAASALELDDLHDVPLICFGGVGPVVGARLAEECHLKSVLIPHHAGILSTIGMLMSNIVIRDREEIEPAPLNLRELRQAFAHLMDRVGNAITMEGYDLDNAVCERVAEVACVGDRESIDIVCDNLADELHLLTDIRNRRLERVGSIETSASFEVRAVRVRATVETLKPELPFPKAANSSLEDAVMKVEDFRDPDTLQRGQVYHREKLPMDAEVKGPALLQERYTMSVIPFGWSARLSAVGDLRLLRQNW